MPYHRKTVVRIHLFNSHLKQKVALINRNQIGQEGLHTIDMYDSWSMNIFFSIHCTHKKDLIVALPHATNEIQNIVLLFAIFPYLNTNNVTHWSPTSKGCIMNTNAIAWKLIGSNQSGCGIECYPPNPSSIIVSDTLS